MRSYPFNQTHNHNFVGDWSLTIPNTNNHSPCRFLSTPSQFPAPRRDDILAARFTFQTPAKLYGRGTTQHKRKSNMQKVNVYLNVSPLSPQNLCYPVGTDIHRLVGAVSDLPTIIIFHRTLKINLCYLYKKTPITLAHFQHSSP